MFVLMAITLSVLPPIPMGRYSTIKECELDRAAFIEIIVQNPTMTREVTFVCQNQKWADSEEAPIPRKEQ
jgi:hypothetical protein